MKKALLDMLVCPLCLPEEHRFRETVFEASQENIVEGMLTCDHCGAGYPVRDGVAFLDTLPPQSDPLRNRYETLPVLSSYLWSHYGDLFEDEYATDAYRQWAQLMEPAAGICLDIGSAVGRFSFEMAKKCDFVVGIDNSVSFIRTSHELMNGRGATLNLPEEGMLTREQRLTLPADWQTDNIEFIVANAQALPFRSGLFSAISSLNIVDKVPKPLTHLTEINRVAKKNDVQFLFSDPFSWSSEVARKEDWLGGKHIGEFSGRGRDNIIALLEGKTGVLLPEWKIDHHGHIWWKIRTHSNHFELIRSCFVKAVR